MKLSLAGVTLACAAAVCVSTSLRADAAPDPAPGVVQVADGCRSVAIEAADVPIADILDRLADRCCLRVRWLSGRGGETIALRLAASHLDEALARVLQGRSYGLSLRPGGRAGCAPFGPRSELWVGSVVANRPTRFVVGAVAPGAGASLRPRIAASALEEFGRQPLVRERRDDGYAMTDREHAELARMVERASSSSGLARSLDAGVAAPLRPDITELMQAAMDASDRSTRRAAQKALLARIEAEPEAAAALARVAGSR